MKKLFEDSLELNLFRIHSDRAEHPWEHLPCPVHHKKAFSPLVAFPALPRQVFLTAAEAGTQVCVCGSPVGGIGDAPCGRQLWHTHFLQCPWGLPTLLVPKLEGGSGSVFAPGQVPMDPWKRLIQEGVLRPEVRRYLFYNSRGFQIAMAVVRALGVVLCPGRGQGLAGQQFPGLTHSCWLPLAMPAHRIPAGGGQGPLSTLCWQSHQSRLSMAG